MPPAPTLQQKIAEIVVMKKKYDELFNNELHSVEWTDDSGEKYTSRFKVQSFRREAADRTGWEPATVQVNITAFDKDGEKLDYDTMEIESREFKELVLLSMNGKLKQHYQEALNRRVPGYSEQPEQIAQQRAQQIALKLRDSLEKMIGTNTTSTFQLTRDVSVDDAAPVIMQYKHGSASTFLMIPPGQSEQPKDESRLKRLKDQDGWIVGQKYKPGNYFLQVIETTDHRVYYKLSPSYQQPNQIYQKEISVEEIKAESDDITTVFQLKGNVSADDAAPILMDKYRASHTFLKFAPGQDDVRDDPRTMLIANWMVDKRQAYGPGDYFLAAVPKKVDKSLFFKLADKRGGSGPAMNRRKTLAARGSSRGRGRGRTSAAPKVAAPRPRRS